MVAKKSFEPRKNENGMSKDRSFLKKPVRDWTVGHYISILTAMGFGGGATNADTLLNFFEPEFSKEDKVLLLDNAKANKKFREEAKIMLTEYREADVHFKEIVSHMNDEQGDLHFTYKEHTDLFVSKREYAEHQLVINKKLDMLIERAMID